MSPQEFDMFREQFNRDCEQLLIKKGSDYAGSVDRHRNFRQGGDFVGVPALVVWAIFFKKHLDAIFAYVRDGKVQSEPILERFKDARNYIDLGAGLVAEMEAKK